MKSSALLNRPKIMMFALLMIGSSLAQAQATGGICQVGQDCGVSGGVSGGIGSPGSLPPGGGSGHGRRPGHGGGHHGPVNPAPSHPIDPSPYDPPQYPSQPPPPQSGYEEQREGYLGQYYRDQYIDVLATVGMNYQSDRGAEIRSVEVYYQSNGRASLFLYADQNQVAATSAMGFSDDLYPNRQVILGRPTRSLQLYVGGKLFVERVIVHYQRNSYQPQPPNQPPQPNPQPPQNGVTLSGSVYQSFYSPGNVDIAQITGLNQYRGYQVSGIIVNGRAISGGNGHARVLIDGVIVGEVYLGSYSNGQSVYPQQTFIVGRNFSDITLLVDGGTEIQTVQVQLSRF